MTRTLLFAATLVLAIGCVERSHVGYFDDHAFYAVRQHYRIRYLPEQEATRALLGPEWRALNLRYENGRPTECMASRDDVTRVELDNDGNGRIDLLAFGERFDLRFEQRENGARLFVRTNPISRSMRDLRLDVLMHEILDHVSDSPKSRDSALEVTQILHEGAVTIGGAPGYQAVFEGAALGSSGEVIATSTDRAHLVLVRPSQRWFTGVTPGSSASAPMVVAFWLVARRENFDEVAPAFDSLLRRTDFREREPR